jgi:hypothetical protein
LKKKKQLEVKEVVDEEVFMKRLVKTPLIEEYDEEDD